MTFPAPAQPSVRSRSRADHPVSQEEEEEEQEEEQEEEEEEEAHKCSFMVA